VKLSDKKGWTCSDFYLIAYQGGFELKEFWFTGEHKITFKQPVNAATLYDIETNGLRVF